MKRLDVNLASAPFVNRVVPMSVLSAVMGAALLLTIFNLASFVMLGAEYRSQKTTLKKQLERMQDLQKNLNRKQSALDSAAVSSFSEEAAIVATMLSEKRFSWLNFLEDFESVKAFGVMMNSVTPQVDPAGVIQLSVRGVANPRSELMRFEQNLFSDARFREVQLHDEQRDSTSPLTTFSLSCVYLPEKTDAP
jgi:hypothetical protein